MLIELLSLTNDIVLRLLREGIERECSSGTRFVNGTGILFNEANKQHRIDLVGRGFVVD